MKNNIAVWFVVGFFCGIGGLLLAMATVPKPVVATQPREANAAETRLVDEQIRLLRQLGKILDRVEKEFTSVGNDASEAALLSDLQTMRSQIELYKIQHLNNPPGFDAEGNFSSELFAKQLTGQTNQKGELYTGVEDWIGSSYGPYLAQMPSNPFVEGFAGSKVKGGKKPAPGNGSSGWYFNIVTGKLSPNDPANKDL